MQMIKIIEICTCHLTSTVFHFLSLVEKKKAEDIQARSLFSSFTAIETVNVFPEQRYQINIFCPLFSFLSETCL